MKYMICHLQSSRFSTAERINFTVIEFAVRRGVFNALKMSHFNYQLMLVHDCIKWNFSSLETSTGDLNWKSMRKWWNNWVFGLLLMHPLTMLERFYVIRRLDRGVSEVVACLTQAANDDSDTITESLIIRQSYLAGAINYLFCSCSLI